MPLIGPRPIKPQQWQTAQPADAHGVQGMTSMQHQTVSTNTDLESTPVDGIECHGLLSPRKTYRQDATPPLTATERTLPDHILGAAARLQRQIADIQSSIGGRLIDVWNAADSETRFDDWVSGGMRRLLVNSRAETTHLCLTTTGGVGREAVVAAEYLRDHTNRLEVHVPSKACSAGTLLAMSADIIRFCSGACLSAVDGSFCKENVRLNEVELPLIRRRPIKGMRHRHGTADGYEHLYKYIHPTDIARALRQTTLTSRYCERLLSYHIKDPKRRRRIIKEMIDGQPEHMYPLTAREVMKIGLPAAQMSDADEGAFFSLYFTHREMGGSFDLENTRYEFTTEAIVSTATETLALIKWSELDRHNGYEKYDTSCWWHIPAVGPYACLPNGNAW